jgi:hypothetical protein
VTAGGTTSRLNKPPVTACFAGRLIGSSAIVTSWYAMRRATQATAWLSRSARTGEREAKWRGGLGSFSIEGDAGQNQREWHEGAQQQVAPRVGRKEGYVEARKQARAQAQQRLGHAASKRALG